MIHIETLTSKDITGEDIRKFVEKTTRGLSRHEKIDAICELI